MAMAAPYRCSLPCPEHESGRGLPLCCRGGDDLNMLQLQRVLGTQYTSTAQQAVMQAKKVLDGSKHEYSTAVQHCTEARTPTAITLCLSIYPYYAVYATNEQASVRCVDGSAPVSPVCGARWWSWAGVWRAAGGAVPGWAAPRRVHRQLPTAGRRKNPSANLWVASSSSSARPRAAAVRCFTQYSPPAGRPAHTSTPATPSAVSVNCWTTSTTAASPATPPPPPRPCSCGAETFGARSCPAPARGASLVTETRQWSVSDW